MQYASWIDSARAQRRNGSGGQRDEDHETSSAGDNNRIPRRDTEQHRFDYATRKHGTKDPNRDTDQYRLHALAHHERRHPFSPSA